MTRTHRSLHRLVWPILALLVVIGVVLALWLRPPPEHAGSSLSSAVASNLAQERAA
jgi:hypothetical protein